MLAEHETKVGRGGERGDQAARQVHTERMREATRRRAGWTPSAHACMPRGGPARRTRRPSGGNVVAEAHLAEVEAIREELGAELREGREAVRLLEEARSARAEATAENEERVLVEMEQLRGSDAAEGKGGQRTGGGGGGAAGGGGRSDGSPGRAQSGAP